MIEAGSYHTLTVNRKSEYGLYLADAEGEEVLLPNRYVTGQEKEGDPLEVFVYHDSEDRPVATTEKPYAVAGQAAFLEVVDKTIHGAFLDWGLPKDLFLPASNQLGRVDAGKKYVVFLYRDGVTGRMTCTTKLNRHVKNTDLSVRPGDEVEVLVAQKNDLGFRVIVNHRHWGMIYANQLFRPVEIGDRIGAFVARITEDDRIDISLQRQGFDEVRDSAERLLQRLKENGGVLPVGDDSAPEEIGRLLGVSKKVFKRSAGHLMKKGLVEVTGDRINLINR